MDEDPFSGYGLQPVRLSDRDVLVPYFQSLGQPLSDYTFSQLYTWRNSLRIYWRLLDGQLCVFANGTGDLTLLLPPIGDGAPDRALRQAWQIMDAYNADHGVPDHSRIEYVSEEVLRRFDASKADAQPMGTDYLYDVGKMIDLPGGDLASKRQAKNRFMRNYAFRVEAYDPHRHLDGCRELLGLWKARQDASRAADPTVNAIKRAKESKACELSLEAAGELGLRGLVVYVQNPRGNRSPCPGYPSGALSPGDQLTPLPTDADGWAIRAFTFGEPLGPDQSSITIEKTDLSVKGLAQFVFSEFCRSCWHDRPLVNVGDDWGLDTLAWTKMSYRPARLLQKYVVRMKTPAQVMFPAPQFEVEPAVVRSARRDDVPAAVILEQSCFDAFSLTKRQLQYLQKRPSTVFVVAEHAGQVVGEGISLVRRPKRSGRACTPTGRIYSLAVSPDWRGRSIGKKLLVAMMDGLTSQGVRRIYLEVEQANRSAVGLYERFGFRQVGELPDYYGPGRHGIHMLYELPAKAPSD